MLVFFLCGLRIRCVGRDRQQRAMHDIIHSGIQGLAGGNRPTVH